MAIKRKQEARKQFFFEKKNQKISTSSSRPVGLGNVVPGPTAIAFKADINIPAKLSVISPPKTASSKTSPSTTSAQD